MAEQRGHLDRLDGRIRGGGIVTASTLYERRNDAADGVPRLPSGPEQTVVADLSDVRVLARDGR
jgi:hypothetical protein